MNKENEMKELALQYFSGTISRENEALLFDFLSQSREHHTQFRQWEIEWKYSHTDDEQTLQALKGLQNRLRTQEAIHPMLPMSRAVVWKQLAAAVAIIVVTLTVTVSLYDVVFPPEETLFALEAPYGEKSKMTLSDGTVVWLNAGSTLTYSNLYDDKNRRVELKGEAYFEVTKNEGHEFVVHTYGYDVVVKGTKFNVSAYPEDSVVSTALLEGEVEVSHPRGKLSMQPGELVELDTKTGIWVHPKTDTGLSCAWSEGRIEFDDITLGQLAVKLSRLFNVRIHIQDADIATQRFRISLRNQETIDEVIEVLAEMLSIRVERKGKDIYIE